MHANDMHDRWDSDAPGYVSEVCANGLAGRLVAKIAPHEGDVFVFKPRYSAFDSTPLEILLEQLEAEQSCSRAWRPRCASRRPLSPLASSASR